MGDFVFNKTNIEGLMLISPKIAEDDRGYFLKFFEKRLFQKNGLPTTFGEDNESLSKKGTLRGIHFQSEYPQGKLVRVIKGAVFDVAVDLRPESPTFGQWQGFELTEKNHMMLYLPERFGHGFLALEDNTIFTYKCTDIYSPKHDDGIMWNDPDIGVKWPVDRVESLIFSEKDKHHQSFAEFKEWEGVH
jgi:dTDP-4-dehydrorhamnose 3,5-epimerase